MRNAELTAVRPFLITHFVLQIPPSLTCSLFVGFAVCGRRVVFTAEGDECKQRNDVRKQRKEFGRKEVPQGGHVDDIYRKRDCRTEQKR